jgi:2'-hydroxyisoflavone reductase
MRILILGGTVFLGRALVDAARERDHEVTLFNRGHTHPDLFPDLERLRGDRDGDVSALLGRSWDAVIDTSGYLPGQVSRSAEALAGSVGLYAFVSSLSVYDDASKPGVNELGRVARIEPARAAEGRPEDYGALKALCETVVEETLPGRALAIRPGLIVGPHDPTDRFSYWPLRIARGGEVLAPGRPTRRIQFIDVRDLAEWIVRAAEQSLTGIFNAVGPKEALDMEQLLHVCRSVSGAAVRVTWVSEDFLLAEGVRAWSELPLWVPESNDSLAGFLSFDASKAIASGLVFRKARETVAATLAWARSERGDRPLAAGITPARESELLDAWSGRWAEESAG